MKIQLHQIEPDEPNRMCADATLAQETFRLTVAASEPLSAPADTFLTLSLYPAMALGEDIALSGVCSARLRKQLDAIQDLTASWWPDRLRPIAVTEPGTLKRPVPQTERCGVFFSGGVDSFYSLLKHGAEITDLILIHGFDYPADDMKLRPAVSEMAGAVAAALGKNLIQVETNARKLFNKQVRWPILHGAVLAGVGQALSGCLGRVYIPSSDHESILLPWGSHPLLDPLWSTEAVEFIHDGVKTSRLDKTREISQSPLVQRYLRVCWQNERSAGRNCGCCEKCLRTMIGLHIAGVLAQCRTFPTHIDLKRLSWIRVDKENRLFLEQNLAALGPSGFDGNLRQALNKAFRRPDWIHELRWHFGNLVRFLKTGRRAGQ